MANDRPLISVVMSNYNGEKYLKPAIDSILAQSYENFEIILIDDGSFDNSVALINEYVKDNPSIKFIRQIENKGQANGFNIGIHEARGDLISLMDSDDLWYPNKLNNVAELFLKNPEAVLYQHNLYIRNGNTTTKTCFRQRLDSGNLLELMKRADKIPLFTPTAGLTFTKDVLKIVGPIPLDFRTCADGYLTRTSMCFGLVCSVNECWGEYRMHENNATIKNPNFSNWEYFNTLLFPKLQQFYIAHKINFDFSNFGQRSIHKDFQTYAPITHFLRICLVGVTRHLLFRFSLIPIISSLMTLLPHRLKEHLNTQRIVQLYRKHDAKRAFIIGMGPSLKTNDLNRLKNEITFACNKIYLCFNETDWRPSYYSVIDILVAQNNKDEIQNLNLTKIFSRSVQDVLAADRNAVWINELPPLKDHDGNRYFKVSEDALYGVYGGFTVIYFQIQLALYMGIREIYLLGLDFSFDVTTPTLETCEHGEILISDGETNHFHKDYRKKGESWTVPQLDMQKMAFRAFLEYAEANGVRIFNASRKTNLKVFERVELDDIL